MLQRLNNAKQDIKIGEIQVSPPFQCTMSVGNQSDHVWQALE